MAHELGHACDRQNLLKEKSSPMMIIVKKRSEAIIASEERAFKKGLNFIPSEYRDAYIQKNKSYLNKLRKNAMFMQS